MNATRLFSGYIERFALTAFDLIMWTKYLNVSTIISFNCKIYSFEICFFHR